MSRTPDFVDWRLRYSHCHVCPLNGQRKVGHDGPPPEEANLFAVAEAPGADEESHGIARGIKYGRPLVGKTGYFWKLEQLGPAGLARIEQRRGSKWPEVKAVEVHMMNVIMCRPPRNKIDSKEGKVAVRCCANGARAFLNEYVYGGETRFPLESELDILKYACRGRKASGQEWEWFVPWWKWFRKFYRACERGMTKDAEKAATTAVLAEHAWLAAWMKEYKKQLAAAKRKAKKENGK